MPRGVGGAVVGHARVTVAQMVELEAPAEAAHAPAARAILPDAVLVTQDHQVQVQMGTDAVLAAARRTEVSEDV